jgi:hypothetical protein
MKRIKDMNLIERFAAPTPDKSKKIGRIASAVAVTVGTVLSLGVITAPIGIGILAGVGVVSTSVAVYHGQKVEVNGGRPNFLAQLFQVLVKK